MKAKVGDLIRLIKDSRLHDVTVKAGTVHTVRALSENNSCVVIFLYNHNAPVKNAIAYWLWPDEYEILPTKNVDAPNVIEEKMTPSNLVYKPDSEYDKVMFFKSVGRLQKFIDLMGYDTKYCYSTQEFFFTRKAGN